MTVPHLDRLVHHLEELRVWYRRYSRDAHLAEDAVQETALIALRHIHGLRDPERMRGWLHRVAQRRMADLLRARRGEQALLTEPVAPEPAAPVNRDRAAQLRKAMRRLPMSLRKPVRMHYLKGRPLRDVAEDLGTTVNGVKARLYRARRLLRQETAQ